MNQVLLAVACATVAISTVAQDYIIRFDRPEKVGDKYRLDATVTEKSKRQVTGDGQNRKMKESFQVRLDAAVTVLEVDETAEMTKGRLVIAGFERKEDDKVTVLLKKGTKLMIQEDVKGVQFLVGGRPVAENIKEALELFFDADARKEDEITDDEVFGTKERKKVGDTWPINAELAARQATAEGIKLDPGNVTGATTVVKKETVNGTPCLRLRSTMKATGFQMPMPGMTLDQSKAAGVFEASFPIDPSLPCLLMRERFEATFSGKGRPDPDGPEVTLEAAHNRSSVTRITVLKQCCRAEKNSAAQKHPDH